MRNFINIIENTLLEDSDYSPMFNPKRREMIDGGASEEDVAAAEKDFAELVKLAKSTMTTPQERQHNRGAKNDRVVWFVKQSLTGDLVDPLVRKHFVGQMAHFYGQPYHEFPAYKFTNQTVTRVLDDMREIEKRFKETEERDSRGIPQGDDKIILRLDNGFAWFFLDRKYCELEAGSMRHCGNESGHPDDRILSLRQLDKKTGKWTPHATFILRDGLLGERKGRFNEKPTSDLHPYILKLLELPIIKGMRGGGYLSENNFHLADLPEETAMALFQRLEFDDMALFDMIIDDPEGRMASEAYNRLHDSEAIYGMSIDTSVGEFSPNPQTFGNGEAVVGDIGVDQITDIELEQIEGLLYDGERYPVSVRLRDNGKTFAAHIMRDPDDLLERDDDGEISREMMGETVSVVLEDGPEAIAMAWFYFHEYQFPDVEITEE